MKRALALIAFVTLAGCSSEPTLTPEQTQVALSSLSEASDVGVEAAIDVSETSGQVSVDATATCFGGGTVSASGTIQADSDSSSLSLDLIYETCTLDDLVIDGVMSYEGSATETSLSFSMRGQVTFSGAIEGTCTINVEMRLDSQSGSITINGSACGNSVSEQL